MVTSSQLATLDDLAAWTMPATDVAPGVFALGDSIAREVASTLGSVFCSEVEVARVALPKRLFSRAISQAGQFTLRLASRETEETLTFAIDLDGWNATVCAFFGGAPDGSADSEPTSPVDMALRGKVANGLLGNISSLMSAYGLQAWKLSEKPAATERADVLSVEFTVIVGGQKVQCRADVPPSLVRRLWDRLAYGDNEAVPFAPRGSVEMLLKAEMSFDRIPMERILDHIDGDVMIVGDAPAQKVRLLCNGVLACEGVLTERNGRYAIEITAVG